MTTIRLRLLAGVLGAMFVSVIFWLGGFDFNERGKEAVFLFVFATGAFVAGATWPYIEVKDDKDK
jgi:hypothetical protein